MFLECVFPGRLADKEGKIRTWWKSTDVKRYNERILCFAKKYRESDTSGSYTLSENIADALGVELSFEALKRNEKFGTRQQLFFVSYAQVTVCNKIEKIRNDTL